MKTYIKTFWSCDSCGETYESQDHCEICENFCFLISKLSSKLPSNLLDELESLDITVKKFVLDVISDKNLIFKEQMNKMDLNNDSRPNTRS